MVPKAPPHSRKDTGWIAPFVGYDKQKIYFHRRPHPSNKGQTVVPCSRLISGKYGCDLCLQKRAIFKENYHPQTNSNFIYIDIDIFLDCNLLIIFVWCYSQNILTLCLYLLLTDRRNICDIMSLLFLTDRWNICDRKCIENYQPQTHDQ